jgi:hypothetical protein
VSAAPSDIRRIALTVAVCTVVLLGVQRLAVPLRDAGTLELGTSVGRTGFAYIGGVRRFAAAVLWNRLDPQFHEYYSGTSLSEQTYMLPTIRMVTALDPQFEQAYYIGSWMVKEAVSAEEGLAFARRGLAANPRSGLLHTNLIQILFSEDKDAHRPEIEALTQSVLTEDLTWMDDEAIYEGLSTARNVLDSYGRTEEARRLDDALTRMRESGVDIGDHDHDGDGIQDH